MAIPDPWAQRNLYAIEVPRLGSFIAAEVGRQPWVVYHILRTEDAITPSLTGRMALFSLIAYVAVYVVIYAFGLTYIYRLLQRGPAAEPEAVSQLPGRPIAAALEGSGQ